MEGETHPYGGGDSSTKGDYTRCYWECLEWLEHSMCRILCISSFKFNILFHFTYKYTQCCIKRIIYSIRDDKNCSIPHRNQSWNF
jgi:hypothetical protein